jgi:hypothetical protein
LAFLQRFPLLQRNPYWVKHLVRRVTRTAKKHDLGDMPDMHDEEKENRFFIMHIRHIPQIMFFVVCDQVLRWKRYSRRAHFALQQRTNKKKVENLEDG